MTARLIDGKAVAAGVLVRVRESVARLTASGRSPPTLATVLVGDDAASQIYVRNKRRTCEEVGIRSRAHNLPVNITQTGLLTLIDGLNSDDDVDGVLVQLPLPPQLDATAVIERVSADKDVDGFHPYNVGRLAQRIPALRPCTPAGVIELLRHTGETFYGRDAVVVGASNHVGRPMALELLLAGATVTVCHRFTRDLDAHVRRAEILVAAVGKPGLICGDWVRDGATVIDVGISRLPDSRLAGDVEFDTARRHAAWITPVPGGVGPMTVAMLMRNTVEAAEHRRD